MWDSCDISSNLSRKHLAQRPVKEWAVYGRLGPGIWSYLFERAVSEAREKVEREGWSGKELISFFEAKRGEIARERETEDADKFGVRRDLSEDKEKNILTLTQLCSSLYFHAMERAVSLPYDGEHFVEENDSDLIQLFRKSFRGHQDSLRYGLVMGNIDGEGVPLTQYVFCPRIKKHRRCESEDWFSANDLCYVGDKKESAVWLHTHETLIAPVMSHIEHLVDRGLKGDMTVIPKIHWWYVHLAPTHRGSGGIAEMLTNTLCRRYGIDLPPWREGVAPSVEVLLEPDEERFCQNYHQLFSENQDYLKEVFQRNDASVPLASSDL
ncbi:hypothetical protein [Endozoicomonas lisbonensis]|uniref:hypothetical protein n=1 Tax=Endozoicomonas lisbonensis TaxID=3120522 RepID=UPI0033938245